MTRHKILFLLILLVILSVLLACDVDVAGIDISTTINQDSSALTVMSLGFIPLDDDEFGSNDIDCSMDEGLPPGTSVDMQFRGSEIWCVITIPSENVDALRAWYTGLTDGFVKINCFQFKDDLFLYDLELFAAGAEDPDEESSGTNAPFNWHLTLPGQINSSNADAQEGNTLTWLWNTNFSPADLPFIVRANLAEGESCPSGATELTLLINDDGAGSAILRIPIPIKAPDLEGVLTEEIGRLGWTITSITPPGNGPGMIESTRPFGSEQEFNRIIKSVPGLAGTSSELKLAISDVEVTGQRVYDFTARQLDMGSHRSYWAALDETLPTPAFELTVSPPGSVESTSGAWTFPNLLVMTWEPQTGVPKVSLSFRSVLNPDNEAEDSYEVEANVKVITDRFLKETETGQVVRDPSFIQKGMLLVMGPGKVNNMTNGQLYACGDYQTRVLKWLDEIRLNPDKATRDQLRGLDYGPIQAYQGGHQAVVLFPMGSDWRITGTVLDPWPDQIPLVFTMNEWTDRFPIGIGVGEGGENFPHMYGGDSFYRGTSLSNSARLNTRQIGVNSPVDVLITATDGRRLGVLPEGTHVNEFPGADYYAQPNGDGTTHWLFGLPAGDYDVLITGTGSGEYHIVAGDGQGALVTYPPQLINPGEQATLSVDPNTIETLLITPLGDSVQPIRVTEENIDELDFGSPPPATSSGRGLGDLGDSSKGIDRKVLLTTIGAVGLCVICVLGLLILGAALYFGFFRRRH